MIFLKRYLISFLLLSAAFSLKADRSAPFINAARKCLEHSEFQHLFECLSGINTFEETQLERTVREIFNGCCAQKAQGFEKCLDTLIETGDCQAYFLSGVLYRFGCSQLGYEQDRILAAVIFLELAQFSPKEEMRSFLPAWRMLEKMKLTPDDRKAIVVRFSEMNDHEHTEKLSQTLATIRE